MADAISPDPPANTNQAFFAMEVLNGCFPMFYNDLGAYYCQITLDASNCSVDPTVPGCLRML